jgi:arylsulfatase A-like enzyme
MKHRFLALLFSLVLAGASVAADVARPNIIWLSSEDHNAHMGCYGDTYATTPNVDKLAAKGMLYRTAWSCAPVCAPARTTVISGMYPPSTGAEHMRSMVPMPSGTKMFPQFLREAGYYTSNNQKEDYNLVKPDGTWDVSSRAAHWRNRKPGQPFFAVFNSEKSHESKIRSRPHKQVHDPAKVRVPAYHPDTKEVRQDWAQYYDGVTDADADAGKRLEELAADGLLEDTIVFYWGDHGSGMPRSKRWPTDSGLHVPVVVYFPEKFKHLAPPDYKAGGKSDRLISFVDYAPTILSLAGIKPPDWMQGHAFLGKFITAPQPFIYGFRGRMDERYDFVRSVRDQRYVYIRNYMPHLPQGQHNNYQMQTPTTAVWKKLFDDGKLNVAQSLFWQPKAAEELYDLENDRDEVNNLSASPAHQEILKRLRKAQQELALKIRDVGFLPEGEIHSRSTGSTPYDMARDEGKYPFKRIFDAAELAAGYQPEALPALKKALTDTDSAVRYWGAMGILIRGTAGVNSARADLEKALTDSSPYVRIAAARALGLHGNDRDLKKALPVLVSLASPAKNGVFVSIPALNAIDALGAKAASVKAEVKAMPSQGTSPNARFNSYVPRLIEKITGDKRGDAE